MAEDTVDHGIVLGGLEPRECVTRELNLHGFHTHPERFGALSAYGSDAPAVEALLASDPKLGEPIHPRLDARFGEVIWAVRQEMARTVDDVLARRPDGVFLSNGPADPAAVTYAIDAARNLLGRVPLMGICLGHQLLALASGARTVKMKFGHHGANHPVQDLDSGQVMITSQNHGFAIDEDSLPDTLEPTHRSLFDGSLQGVAHTAKPAFGFQGHPEASPGPHDISTVIESNLDLGHGNFLLDFKAAKMATAMRPAQFFMIGIPGSEALLRRPFSVCGLPGKVPSQSAGSTTIGHSRPLARWAVSSATASSPPTRAVSSSSVALVRSRAARKKAIASWTVSASGGSNASAARP